MVSVREQSELLDRDPTEAEAGPLPVVGIGVCAESLRSLEALFGDIGTDLGAAYLIAVRRQEGLDVATVVEVLTRRTSLPVTIGEDGEKIEGNHIYVGGSDDLITLTDGHLGVRPAAQPVGHRGTIDTMLMSIAEHAHDRAVAVILGGLGSDGTAGVTATKKYGGLSIAEADTPDDDHGAKGGAGPFGVVDLHIPIDRIAGEIAHYLANVIIADAEAQEATPEQIEAQLAQVTTVLRNTLGHDFHGYKRGTLLRRVHRRLQVLQIDTIDAYVARLRSDRQEVQDLFQDLLIGVTQFFRDPGEFDVLEGELPRLFKGKGPEDQFRVWVLGCATGEEAYSLAILLREHMATLVQPPQVQIFATDLDARALGLARAGRYTDAIAAHIRPDRLERWFSREGDTYCVSKELREMCIFSPQNIVKDAPFSRIDILSCRNLLIYLNADIQSRVIPIFHFSLRSGGVLFLGSSENVTRHQKLFAPIDRGNRVFRRLDTATRIIPDFPLSSRSRALATLDMAPADAPAPTRLTANVSRQAELIAERYAPAYVVVDSRFEVLHFSGRTGRFLEPVAGTATLDVISLVHRDLRIDLRSALHRALSEARRIEVPRLVMQQDDRATGVNLVVEPIGTGDVTSLIVLFQDVGEMPWGAAGGEEAGGSDHVERLESELRLTRDRLQATIEELESTNEELKSSNEEYQSINEELQSANEEMETSKEELQSVNEELQTVNGELGHRVAELGRSNSDLKNLLDATQIATLFLDNDLRVRSFTPSAIDIFHLLDTDVGRPLGHVVSRVNYPTLQEDVQRVLKTLVPIDRTVVDPSTGRHFAARVLPYRRVDNYISGAVVTFTDLTAVHQAETAVRESEERLHSLVEGLTQLVWRSVDLGQWTWASRQWAEYTGQSEAESRDRGWLAVLHPDDRTRATDAWNDAAERGGFEIEYRVRRASDGAYRWFQTRVTPIRDENGLIVEWIGASTEINDLRELQERQGVLVGELQHRTRNLIGIVRQVALKTARGSSDLDDFRDRFRKRLDALARVQGLLSRLNEHDRVTFDELVATELAAHGVDPGGDGRVITEGPSGIRLRSSTVQTLAMAVHELATNAVKYGALGQPEAALAIRWRVDNAAEAGEQPWLHIDWRESGVAMPPPGDVAQGGGQGRELIERALPYQLAAHTTYVLEENGVHCTIAIPISASNRAR